jgi:NADH-quinone oxidoreductase subunit J
MVLFVFVIMLLNAGAEERTNLSKLAGTIGIPLALALTGLLAAAVARSTDAVQAATQTGTTAPTKALANLLFQDFVYPFELTSFLILVAILGAIVLAAPRSER